MFHPLQLYTLGWNKYCAATSLVDNFQFKKITRCIICGWLRTQCFHAKLTMSRGFLWSAWFWYTPTLIPRPLLWQPLLQHGQRFRDEEGAIIQRNGGNLSKHIKIGWMVGVSELHFSKASSQRIFSTYNNKTIIYRIMPYHIYTVYNVKSRIYRKYSSSTFGSLGYFHDITTFMSPDSCPPSTSLGGVLILLIHAGILCRDGEMSDQRCLDHPNFFNDWQLYTTYISH